MAHNPRADGLKLWQRIILIALVGTVPLFVVSTFLVRSSYTASLEQTGLEREGVAFQRPLADLLELLPRYRIIANRARVDEAARDTLTAVRLQIDGALQSVNGAFSGQTRLAQRFSDSELLARGRREARLSALHAHWDTARTHLGDTTGSGALDRTIESAQAMIRHAGDQSKLVLDGNLDSYYLVAITSTLLPKSQVRLAQAITHITTLKDAGLNNELRGEASTLSALIRLDLLEPILRNAKTALVEDDNFFGRSESLQANLPPAVEAFRTSSYAFCALLDRVKAGENISTLMLEGAGRQALADGDYLWNIATSELDRLLVIRERAIRDEQRQHFAVVLVTLVVALGVMGWIIRGLLASRFREVAATEQQLRMIGDNQPNAMVYEVVDGEAGAWQFRYVSAGVERLHGVSVADAMRDASLVFGQILLEDRDLAAQARQSSIDTNEPMDVTVRVRRVDGKVRWMQFTSAPRLLPDGRRVWDGIETDVTERRQMQDALRKSEELFRTSFENATTGVCLISPDGHYLKANRTLSMWLGYEHPELEALSVHDITVPEDRAIGQDFITSALNGGPATGRLEKRYLRKDGSVLWVDISTVLMPATDGHDAYFVSHVQDVTERKSAQVRIQYLNRVYAVLSGINEMIVREKDPAVIMQRACAIAVERGQFRMAWIGLLDEDRRWLRPQATAGHVEGYLDIDSFDLSDPERAAGPSGRCVLSGQRVTANDIEHEPSYARWRNAALSRGYRSSSGLPLRIDGKVIGLIHLYASETDFFDEAELLLLDELAADIGFALEVQQREEARRLAEENLRVSEARFRQVADNIREVFWMTDATRSRILYVSAAYERIWGYSRQGLLESLNQWGNSIHPDDRARVLEAAATRQLTGEYDEIYRIIRPDGTIRWIHDRAMPVLDDAGVVLHIVGTAEDITRQRELEDQFRQSQKMEAIGQLAGGVAHDFNNILAAIMFEAEFANAEGIPEDTRDRLRNILSFSERAANLTQQLLLFSRRQIMQLREVDVNNVVGNLSKMLQRIIGEDIELQLNLHSSSLVTRADAGMLDQVLMNLVVNARDAMPSGGRLRIETFGSVVGDEATRMHPDASAGHYAVLRVRDTGVGISDAVLPRIFEPFYTTKAPGKGTGLGLATVFGIARQHRGWVSVQSAVGTGTTFEVYLPAVSATVTQAAEAKTRERPKGGTEAILLVEDESSLRRLSRDILSRAGYKVLEAASGVDALEVFGADDGTVKLVVTDMVMPGGLGGLEMAARMVQSRPGVKVIFTSGYNPEIAGQDLVLEPGQNFLQKPYSSRVLLEAVRRSLDS